jgi:16S rRNA (cytidine1402-2'-O)-methyltransferase
MGKLYIVPTPLGNLEDITIRAKRILANVDAVLAEDTRTSRRLLDHLGIRQSLRSYHDFNKEKVTPTLIGELRQGAEFALVSDAGTPGIADPAFYLVREAVRSGIEVIPLPGPVACITALVASGLPTDRFLFENFLPPKSGKRRTLLTELAGETRTVIFYESPYRISKVLRDMQEVLGEVRIVIAREMTKMHEEFLRGTAVQLLEHFEHHPPKGEMTVLFNPRIRDESGA